jgi:pyruvate formate lyase activating enzyme
VAKLSEWMVTHLGPDVPLHFSGFHPDFKMRDVPATPPETLRRARRQAKDAGLRHVYVGNVHDVAADTTFCHGCQRPLIVRDWYELLDYRVTRDGTCPDCGTALAGRFADKPGAWGRKRLPVVIGE